MKSDIHEEENNHANNHTSIAKNINYSRLLSNNMK